MAENIIFSSPDGSHSNNALAAFGATPETFELLGLSLIHI